MKFDAANIRAIAETTRFEASNLEKLLRLRELLAEIHKHPFLSGRLVLKGGTALNLFYLNLTRLSVDLDLNYIAQIDREKIVPRTARGGKGYRWAFRISLRQPDTVDEAELHLEDLRWRSAWPFLRRIRSCPFPGRCTEEASVSCCLNGKFHSVYCARIFRTDVHMPFCAPTACPQYYRWP
jgi:hypothetical protein